MAKKLPNDALLTEIIQQVSSAKTKKEKIALLQSTTTMDLDQS